MVQNFVNATIIFGRHGNSGSLQIADWSDPEDEHTWSNGDFELAPLFETTG
jgi:hypothetical protein